MDLAWGFRNYAAAVCLVLAAILFGGCPGPETLAPPNLDPQSVDGEVHWLRLVHITDPQIADEESPARAVRADPIIPASWRPHEGYGAHVLDATLRQINKRHQAGKGLGRPVDFVVVTGDLAELAQSNELKWFLDIMDGEWVTPDSGVLDGAERDVAPEDNPKLGFQAEGLAPDIPWYTAYGNHDGLAVGNFAIDSVHPDAGHWFSALLPPVAYVIGLQLIDPSLSALVPTLNASPAIILGSRDAADPTTLRLPLGGLRHGPIVSDAARHFLSRRLFIERHFDTSSLPQGHGFSEENLVTGRARYSVHPKKGVPVRLVVMNTVAPNPLPGLPFFYGVMTREQFRNFVQSEIEDARDKGEFVILASHHPSGDFRFPYPGDTVTTAEFRDYMASQPNIIVHLVGHTHRQNVSLIPGAFPYLEIETSAIIDYPQEGRILDVFFNSTLQTVRIESIIFGHGDDPSRLSAEGLRRASVDAGLVNKDGGAIVGRGLIEGYMDAEMEKAYLEEVPLWPAPLSREDRYGEAEDRDFSITLHR